MRSGGRSVAGLSLGWRLNATYDFVCFCRRNDLTSDRQVQHPGPVRELRILKRSWPVFLALLWCLVSPQAAPAAPTAVTVTVEPGPMASVSNAGQSFWQPVEQNLPWGSIRLFRSVRWWCRHAYWAAGRAVRAWWRWVARAAALLLLGVALALCDRALLQQWRAQGWGVFRVYLPLGILVYILALFDRRATWLGRLAVGAALVYGVVPRDLIPDHLLAGSMDDIVIIGAASRLFVHTCARDVIESHARWVQDWRQRTHQIRRRRRQKGRQPSAG